MSAEFEHHTARLSEVQLHYAKAGSGDPVVLLHGWPETWYQWRKVIPDLAERYTVIAPDMRGLGDSSKPATGYDKRRVAADIHELVQELGFDRIRIVGHDWGGPVAYAYACAHRDTVQHLVIADCPIITRAEDLTGFWHVQFQSVRDLPEALVAGRERLYLTWFYRAAGNPTAVSDDAIDEYVRCYSAPGGMRAGFEYYRAVPLDAEHNRENAKQKLEMPVLALGGALSLGEACIESLRDLTTDLRGEVFENCGHWIAEEVPDLLVDRLIRFFEGSDRS
ncbi:MAG: alpha/beta hydrolase [Deltaproteobacteria bacterium]|nr:alpha/beta hydrolase [Deltaproteobacteria bacterium]